MNVRNRNPNFTRKVYMKKYLLFSSIFEKILFYLLLLNRIDFKISNKEIDSVIWEWTKKQMEFLYFLVLTFGPKKVKRFQEIE